MKRLLSVGFILAFISLPVFAGGYFMNDTGGIVCGLRVEFSKPVTITSFGGVLTSIHPPGESTTFTFSGGAVETWGDHWIIWEPATAQILSHEWIASPAALNEVRGACVYVDRTYAIPIVIASITARDLREAGIGIGDEITVTVGDAVLTMPLDYPPSVVPMGGNIAYLLWGELRIRNRGNDFPTMYGVTAGMPITVRLREKGKYARSAVVTDLDRYWGDDWSLEAQSISSLETASSTLSPIHVSGSELRNASGGRVILRGAAVKDPCWAIHEGAPVLKRDFRMIKHWGGNVVHIPVHPEAWKQAGGMQYLEAYLDPLIRWAGELGLYAIISWKAHGDPEKGPVSRGEYDPDMVLARQALATLAARYADCSWVMYSVFNEPDSYVRWERFRLCMIDLVDAVRSQARNAVVLVPGVDVAADLSSIPGNPIPRDNIVYTADVYPWVWDKTPFVQDAERLLDTGYPLLIFEWGYDIHGDESDFSHTCQYATSESLGRPLLGFCEENGISWTAWVWSDDWCPHMFYDYERIQPTSFGQVVMDSLADQALPPVSWTSPQVVVEPEEAAVARCGVIDRLGGSCKGIPSTIIEAQAAPGWEFDHWEGPIDWPDWRVVSVDLDVAEAIRCVFRELPETREARLREEAWQARVAEIQSVLEEWVRMAAETPPVLAFDPDVQPSFYQDRQRNLAESVHWGDEGTGVESLRFEVADGFVKILVELREGDRIGGAGYVVTCAGGALKLYFFLRPAQGYAEARFGLVDSLEIYRDELWRADERSLAMVFPLDRHAQDHPLLLDLVADMHVFLEVEYLDDDGREVFVYPGAGRIGTENSTGDHAMPGPEPSVDIPEPAEEAAGLVVSEALASFRDDLPEDPESNFARLLSEEELQGAIVGMIWSTLEADLTCWVDAAIPADATGVVVVAAASETMELRILAAADCSYRNSAVAHLSPEQQEYQFRFSTWTEAAVQTCAETSPPNAWGLIKRLTFIPSETEGELRIYSIDFLREE